jgi:hypothetical protein
MAKGKYVLAQILELVTRAEFSRCVEKYQGNYRVRSFSCRDQFICLAFGQLTYRESLRDIVTCLNAQKAKHYQIGLRGDVARSTLADANEKRDWRIYADLAQVLIRKFRKDTQLDHTSQIELDNVIYALDSTIIDLCLNVFWWAKFRKHKAAIKLHTLLDIRCEIPCFIHITAAAVHDVNVLDILEFEADAIYIMDRGYIDWERLYTIHKTQSYFVIRAKNNLSFERHYSQKVDKDTGLRCDQIISLKGYKASKNYPEKLRRIKFYDAEHQKTYVYLTNHFEADTMQIVLLYINRWKVEIFFKWIKQHLRIKVFWGESANAVKTQIWVAICTFVLVAMLKEKWKIPHSMNNILQILSVCAFDKVLVNQLFSLNDEPAGNYEAHNQLNLFDL